MAQYDPLAAQARRQGFWLGVVAGALPFAIILIIVLAVQLG